MNLASQIDRQRLIQSIEAEPNKARKQWSLRQFEVQNGRIQQFVKESLEGQLYEDTVREMPIVSSINIQGRITDAKATIYKKPPVRIFTSLKEGSDEKEKLDLIYKDMKADMKLNKMNKNYCYQDQSIGMILPKKGKLIMRIMLMHQIDAIPDEQDPEEAKGYVLSVFDRENYIQLYQDKKEIDTATGQTPRSLRSSASPQDAESSEVSTEYDFMKYVQKYIVWDDTYNFMMNGYGEIIDPESGNPSNDVEYFSPLIDEGIMPFFEVSKEKDFEYFVRAGNAYTDFTIQFNERLSDLANNIKMNGYAVGILKSPSDLKPQNMIIGHSQLVHLPTDNPDADVDFKFASPNSNISEISEANDRFLNYFITSAGLGGEVVNSNGEVERPTSGIDRFLRAVQKMEAHQDDYEVFRCAESDIYRIIKAWLRVLNGKDVIDKKYQIPNLSPDSEVIVDFYQPEMMQTESEKLNNIERKLDLGLMSQKEALMELRKIKDDKEAEKILKQINGDSGSPDDVENEEDA